MLGFSPVLAQSLCHAMLESVALHDRERTKTGIGMVKVSQFSSNCRLTKT